jgi:hypothetical protein
LNTVEVRTLHDPIPSRLEIRSTETGDLVGIPPSDKVGFLEGVDELRLARIEGIGQ